MCIIDDGLEVLYGQHLTIISATTSLVYVQYCDLYLTETRSKRITSGWALHRSASEYLALAPRGWEFYRKIVGVHLGFPLPRIAMID